MINTLELHKIAVIDVSKDGRVLTAGDIEGNLGIYDLKKKKNVKILEKIHQKSILSTKIIHNNSNKVNNSHIISSDISGIIKISILSKGMFYYSATTKILIDQVGI